MDPMKSERAAWVIVPAFNEAARVGDCLRNLLRENRYQIVVIDDGSSDETVDVIQRFPVWCLRHPVNCGQGAAIRTGIDFALAKGAEFVVTFDADGQHDPDDIEQLLEPLKEGQQDVALGTRFLGRTIGMPASRQWLLRVATVFTRLTTGLKLTDSHNGLRAFSRHAASRITIRQPRMAHASEILHQVKRHRLRYVEVPVTIRYTKETLKKGQSALDAARIGSELILGRFAK